MWSETTLQSYGSSVLLMLKFNCQWKVAYRRFFELKFKYLRDWLIENKCVRVYGKFAYWRRGLVNRFRLSFLSSWLCQLGFIWYLNRLSSQNSTSSKYSGIFALSSSMMRMAQEVANGREKEEKHVAKLWKMFHHQWIVYWSYQHITDYCTFEE